MKKITTDNALIFSALILISYTIACIVLEFLDKVPDSTLTASIFLAFGVAEGGFCTYIHMLKKKYTKEDKNGEQII